jgi:hypothetical protein
VYLENKTLCDILPVETISYIHPDYLSAYMPDNTSGRAKWFSWLHNSLGLNTAPWVLDNGNLSPEFQKIITTLDPIHILIILREFWPQISVKLSNTSRRESVCENGEWQALPH